MDANKIENYSEHRERFASKGRGNAFMAAIQQMDQYISNPTEFRSIARTNRVQIKTERDIEKQLNIKQEKTDVVKRSLNASKSLDKTSAWHEEKKNIVQQIVLLKTENQNILLEVKNKQSECITLLSQKEELERQIVIKVSELDSLKNTLEKVLAHEAEQNRQHEKIISKLTRENELLLARTKQFQTGIDQKSERENKQNESAAEDVYAVEKILDRKKKNSVWFYKIRWEGYGPDDDTWERESNLKCTEILEEFKMSISSKNK